MPARASASTAPDRKVPASLSLARALLAMLAEQRPAFLAFVRKRSARVPTRTILFSKPS